MSRSLKKNTNGSFAPVKHIALGVDFLGRSLDPIHHYPNILMLNDGQQAWHCHDFADFGDLTSRYLEALVLAEADAGVKASPEIRSVMERLFYSYFGEDGLSYRPATGEPWMSYITKRAYESDIAEGFDQSRVMYALLALHQLAGDPRAQPAFTRLINGVRARAVFRGDYMYFTSPVFRKPAGPPPAGEPYPQQLYFAQTMIHPLVLWWQLTGAELALETAQKLAHFVMKDHEYFGPDGSFLSLQTTAPGTWDLINGHTHSRLGTIAGLLALGRLTADSETLEFGKRAFDWFRSTYCLASGWCPEFLGRYSIEQEGCETCALMDMIHCCLELAETGHPEYWPVLDRLVRNQLVEQQLVNARFVPPPEEKKREEFARYPIEFDAVRGGFGGWCGVNDFVGSNMHSRCMMHCCGPSGVKALCLALRNIVHWRSNVLRINLRFTHQVPQVSIVSHEPLEGRLDLEPKVRGTLRLRMPEWVPPGQSRLTINGKAVEPAWHEGELSVSRIEPGQKICVEYPLRESTRREKVGSLSYESHWRGDTIISIFPSGVHVPLYQRGK